MSKYIFKLSAIFFILNLLSCSQSMYKQVKVPKYCVDLKTKLKNRIIPINDSVYTFNFKFPQVDTFRETFETKRVFEYRAFYKFLFNLPEDSLKKCKLDEKTIKKLIGNPSDITIINKSNNICKKGKFYNYLLDFGLNCNPNQRYLKSSENCNVLRFELDTLGILYKIKCSSNEFGIEPKLEKIHDEIKKGIRTR